LLTNKERNWASGNPTIEVPKEPISLDDKYKGEDGIVRPFLMYRPNDVIFHSHDGIDMEQNASATVFAGGFRCWVCNKSYGVPRSKSMEESFDFEDTLVETENPHMRLPNIDWISQQTQKFCVISAPMGSGKTEQLVHLVDMLVENQHQSILRIIFRRMLAQQQANRLACYCYLFVNLLTLKNNLPDQLVCGVNSLDLIVD
jgi:hypothetical protein